MVGQLGGNRERRIWLLLPIPRPPSSCSHRHPSSRLRRSRWHIRRPVVVSLRWGWGPMWSCGGGGRRTDAVGHQRPGATADQSHSTPMGGCSSAAEARQIPSMPCRRNNWGRGSSRGAPLSTADAPIPRRQREDREAQPSFTQAADDDAHPQEGATTIGGTEEERRRRRCSIPMVLLRRPPASSW